LGSSGPLLQSRYAECFLLDAAHVCRRHGVFGEGDRSKLMTKTRTAVRVAGVTAVALAAALWGRSYQAQDIVWGWLGVPGYVQVNSSRGCLKIIVNCERNDFQWRYKSTSPEVPANVWHYDLERNPRFGWWLDVAMPHYVVLVLCGAIARITWEWPIRFRLRDVLVAMTLLALLLGAAAAS
jgi:hypothetical protein